MNASAELFVTVPTGVRLCYQTFGDPRDPAVLLIPGAGSSMVAFRPDLIALLSPPSDPHFVIRFDNRDTGRSTAFPAPKEGEPPAYTLMDMTNDIIGLIEHLGAKPVHIVGGSFGGPMAYIIAATRPELVKSLSLFLTSPVGGSPTEADGLPPVKEEGIRLIQALPYPTNQSDRASWVEYTYKSLVAFAYLPLSGPELAEDRSLAETIVDREWDSGAIISKGVNHGQASMGRWPRELLSKIKIPATVIQAEKDQFYDVAHGEALARDIAGAEYVLLKDTGHEIPRRVWGLITEILLRTFKRAEAAEL